MNFPFYTTAAQAKFVGFTHHGRMFNVPCWITLGDCPDVMAKFAPLELWISLCTGAFQLLSYMGVENQGFPIAVGQPIDSHCN